MPAGRPDKFKDEYIELAKDTIGRQGKSIVQFARDIGVGKSSVYRWAEKNEEFREALSLAKDWSEAFWMDKIEGWMDDRNSNGKVIGLYLANRFGWRSEGNDKNKEEKPMPSVIIIS